MEHPQRAREQNAQEEVAPGHVNHVGCLSFREPCVMGSFCEAARQAEEFQSCGAQLLAEEMGAGATWKQELLPQ